VNGKKARKIRKKVEKELIGVDIKKTRKCYQELKKYYKLTKKING
jgi:hypothetical protein